jgi:hypothetical protein
VISSKYRFQCQQSFNFNQYVQQRLWCRVMGGRGRKQVYRLDRSVSSRQSCSTKMSGINVNVCRSAQFTRRTIFGLVHRETIRKCSHNGRPSLWTTTSTRRFATKSGDKSTANTSNTTTGSGSSGRLSQSNLRQAESLLNTHMDKAAANASRAGRPGSDGIFYMGIRPGDYEKPKNYKSWKQLGTAGKGA